jgi:hypothetical protein
MQPEARASGFFMSIRNRLIHPAAQFIGIVGAQLDIAILIQHQHPHPAT